MLRECENIKRQLSVSEKLRPAWDAKLLLGLGYTDIVTDTSLSSRIYRQRDEFYNPTPMFLIRAKKP